MYGVGPGEASPSIGGFFGLDFDVIKNVAYFSVLGVLEILGFDYIIASVILFHIALI